MTAARIATALAELADLHEQLGLLVWATRPARHAPPGPRTPDLDMIRERVDLEAARARRAVEESPPWEPWAGWPAEQENPS